MFKKINHTIFAAKLFQGNKKFFKNSWKDHQKVESELVEFELVEFELVEFELVEFELVEFELVEFTNINVIVKSK